jgi:hypothetical protein
LSYVFPSANTLVPIKPGTDGNATNNSQHISIPITSDGTSVTSASNPRMDSEVEESVTDNSGSQAGSNFGNLVLAAPAPLAVSDIPTEVDVACPLVLAVPAPPAVSDIPTEVDVACPHVLAAPAPLAVSDIPTEVDVACPSRSEAIAPDSITMIAADACAPTTSNLIADVANVSTNASITSSSSVDIISHSSDIVLPQTIRKSGKMRPGPSNTPRYVLTYFFRYLL